jgi:hypothetical protein
MNELPTARGQEEFLAAAEPVIQELVSMLTALQGLSPDSLHGALMQLAAGKYRAAFVNNGGEVDDAIFDAGRELQLSQVHLRFIRQIAQPA